jgi:hypothetical protein
MCGNGTGRCEDSNGGVRFVMAQKVGPMKGDDAGVGAAATWWPPAIVVAPGASAIERQSAELLATWCGKYIIQPLVELYGDCMMALKVS